MTKCLYPICDILSWILILLMCTDNSSICQADMTPTYAIKFLFWLIPKIFLDLYLYANSKFLRVSLFMIITLFYLSKKHNNYIKI